MSWTAKFVGADLCVCPVLCLGQTHKSAPTVFSIIELLLPDLDNAEIAC